jgi:DNA primase
MCLEQIMNSKNLLATANILHITEQDTKLTRLANTNGGEWAGPCPFCGGRDRFRVWPKQGNFWCRRCGSKGDAIDYIRLRDGLSFVEASNLLRQTNINKMYRNQDEQNEPGQLHKWQEFASQVLEHCSGILWSNIGEKARAWLDNRGLSDDTLRYWKIGYSPGARIAGVYLERGITIPCYVEGKLWFIKLRRPCGEPKYRMIKGSHSGLFGVDTLEGKTTAVLCEGEFDTMLLWQEAGDLTGVFTLGSATAKMDLTMWGHYLMPLQRILIAYDCDEAGQRGSHALQKLSKRIKRLEIPNTHLEGKDITDLYLSGVSLREWLARELAIYGPKPIAVQPIDVEEAWWSIAFSGLGVEDPTIGIINR